MLTTWLWVYVVEAIAIVTANTITLVIFSRTPRLRTRKYCMLVNLAVADLLVGVVLVPFYIYAIKPIEGPWNIPIMITFQIVDPFFGIASLLGLAALAVERSYATYYPIKHRTLNRTPYIVGISVVWLLAMFLTLPFSFLPIGTVSNGIMTLTAIAIPLIVIKTAYFLIWLKVSCRRTVLGHEIHQINKKLTVTLAIVTIVSLIAWVPFLAVSVHFSLCYPLCPKYLSNSNMFALLKFLHYSNSFVNFIIYSMRMREFKTEMLRRIRCCRSPPNVENQIFELQQNNRIPPHP